VVGNSNEIQASRISIRVATKLPSNPTSYLPSYLAGSLIRYLAIVLQKEIGILSASMLTNKVCSEEPYMTTARFASSGVWKCSWAARANNISWVLSNAQLVISGQEAAKPKR
jgi:uncharacterized protein YodC (DUF2158 family)